MAKGENIFRRRDGRWEARYSKGRELSGKIKYGYCYGKTYREAKEKAEKCKAALASGNPLPTSRTPNLFSAYLFCFGYYRKWLQNLCKLHLNSGYLAVQHKRRLHMDDLFYDRIHQCQRNIVLTFAEHKLHGEGAGTAAV